MKQFKAVVVHTTDSPASMDIGREEIAQWHKDKGWTDIGYHYVIRRDGTVELGRDLDKDGDVLDEKGAHVYGHNKDTIGIVLVGGHKGKFDFTLAQIMVLVQLCKELEDRTEVFCGHTDLDSGKTCPNFDVSYILLESIAKEKLFQYKEGRIE